MLQGGVRRAIHHKCSGCQAALLHDQGQGLPPPCGPPIMPHAQDGFCREVCGRCVIIHAGYCCRCTRWMRWCPTRQMQKADSLAIIVYGGCCTGDK